MRPVAQTARCALLVVVLASGALAQTVGGLAGKRAAQSPRLPNVVLITIDTVRADHLGCYGATNVRTPSLDELARDGILYERAVSQVPLTWPSHVAMLTGTYPVHNGVQDFTGQPLAVDFRTVAQTFQDHGYATAAVVSSFVLDRSWGLARGFADYDDSFGGNEFLRNNIALVERKAAESVNRSLTWLQHRPAKPFFLWLHLYDPHSPYEPPEPFRAQYGDHPYDGEIAYADSQLGRLTAWLKQNHLYQQTAIVVTSDHGESLGEHGEKEHGLFIYNSTIHVPLIIKPVAAGARGRRVSEVVEITAIAPTLLGLAGIDDRISGQFDAASLLPKPKLDAAFSETMYPFSSFGWSPLHSLETGDYHYIEAPRPELYNLRDDPRETHNVVAEQPAIAATMKQQLRARRAPRSSKPGPAPAADDATLAKLRALGYLAYRSPVPSAALDKLPDPKDKVEELETILKASDAFRLGEFARGQALLEPLGKSDPQLYLIPFMLGEAALRQQNWSEAAQQLQRALELNSEFDQAMTALAQALHGLGQDAEAEAWLKKALQKNSRNFRAWYQMGFIQSREHPQEALVSYRKALEIQPNFALALRDVGLIEIRARDYANAAQHLQKAADLGLNDAPLFNFLGIAYSRTGQLQNAVSSYRKALATNPDLAEAHLNLGFAYERLQQPARAGEEYAAACRLDEKLCRKP